MKNNKINSRSSLNLVNCMVSSHSIEHVLLSRYTDIIARIYNTANKHSDQADLFFDCLRLRRKEFLILYGFN